MQTNKQPQPQPQQQPEEDLLAVSLEGARKFVVANWLHLVFVLALIAAVAMGVRAYQYRHEAHVMAAWGELGSVPADELQFVALPDQAAQIRQQTLTTVEDVVKNPPEAAAVPWAMLQLGSLQADGGDWAAAARTFSDLTTKYPASEPVGTARAALATSMEGLGKYKEAAEIYESLVSDEQPYYLLSAARCRELAGELGPAKQLYEKLRDSKTKDQNLVQVAAARLEDLAMGLPLTMPSVVQAAKLAVPGPSPVPAAVPATTVGQPPLPAPEPAKPTAQPDKSAPQPGSAAPLPGKPAGENR